MLDIINDAADFNILPRARDCYIVLPSHMAFLLDASRLKFVPFDTDVMPPVGIKAVWKRLKDSNLIQSFIDSIVTVVSEKETSDLLNKRPA